MPNTSIYSTFHSHPYGMLMDGRSYASYNYRFTFNGKESDREISGIDNWQDYGERMYSTKLGRFLSPDPIIINDQQYPELSSYQFASNTPVIAIDLDGLEAVVYTIGGDLQAGKEGNQHTLISVMDANNLLTVWSYGRYTLGKGHSKRPGVLLKYTGKKAERFLRIEFFKNKIIGGSKAFLIPEVDAAKVNSYFNAKLSSGTEIPEDLKDGEIKDSESDKSSGTFEAKIIDTYNVYKGRTCVGITRRALKFAGFDPDKELESPEKYSDKQKVKGYLKVQWTVQVFTARLLKTSTSKKQPNKVKDVTSEENNDTGSVLKKLKK